MKLITNPDVFFEELNQKEVRIRKPPDDSRGSRYCSIGISIPSDDKAQSGVPTRLSQIFHGWSVHRNNRLSFIGIFAVWLILAVIMHGLSAFFDSKGSFRRTFEFTGYGFLLSLIGSLITIPMSIHYI